MKYKIGDRVEVIKNVDYMDTLGLKGTVTCATPSGGYALEVTHDKEYSWHRKTRQYHLDNLKLIQPNNKILITSDGTNTLARLYEGNKVVKSAEAKCAPSDTYNFELGANLAFNRLVFGTDYKPDEVKFNKTPTKPEPPKHEYKAGDKVRVIANTCFHNSRVGEIITLERKRDCGVANWYYKEHLGYIGESDIEPYTEPKQEPIKLYCVKSDGFFQEGKTYTIESDGTLMLERGYEDNHKDFAEVLRVHPQMKGKIFPLVSRPAKVGEWVYVEKQNEKKSNLHHYNVGRIYKVFCANEVDGVEGCVYFAQDGNGNVEPDSYLVLDGYTEEEKPKYYNGKVICIKTNNEGLTARKIYDITDGVLCWNSGNKCSRLFTSLEDLNSWDWFHPGTQFIEYKGEA